MELAAKPSEISPSSYSMAVMVPLLIICVLDWVVVTTRDFVWRRTWVNARGGMEKEEAKNSDTKTRGA